MIEYEIATTMNSIREIASMANSILIPFASLVRAGAASGTQLSSLQFQRVNRLCSTHQFTSKFRAQFTALFYSKS